MLVSLCLQGHQSGGGVACLRAMHPGTLWEPEAMLSEAALLKWLWGFFGALFKCRVCFQGSGWGQGQETGPES